MYECALRAEEKIARKQSFNKGQGSTKGRGQAVGRGIFGSHREESSNSNQQDRHGRGGNSSRRGPYQGGKVRGRGIEAVVRCHK